LTTDLRVGRVLRTGTRGFVVGCARVREHIPAFGALVSCAPPAGDGAIYGLIYDVSVEDDPFVRQLVAADLPEEVLRDRRENRQVPIEVSVLVVGSRKGQIIRHCLPPQPPVTLDRLHQCTDEEVRSLDSLDDMMYHTMYPAIYYQEEKPMARYPLNLPAQLKAEAEKWAARQGISLNQFIMWAVAEKVGTLSQGLDDPAFPRVTYRRGAAGQPTPVLRGTGLRVQTIVVAAQHWKLTPAQIATEYDLTEAQVSEALAFYQAHRTEIDAAIAAEQAMEAMEATEAAHA